MFYKKQLHLFSLYHYFSNRVKMSCNIGDNRNLFLKLKSELDFIMLYIQLQKLLPKNVHWL